MFKKVFLIIMLCVGVFSLGSFGYAGGFSEDYEWGEECFDDFQGLILGVGAAYVSSPYAGDDGDVWPVPIVLGRDGRFYADGTSLGFILSEFDEPNLDFSIVGMPRFMGYENDDATILNGMEDRDWSFDAGLRARWNNEYFRLAVTGLQDITGNHEGQEFNAYISKAFLEGAVTPRFGIKWQSDNLVDYYYGVNNAEATATRLAYEGDSTVNIVAGIVVAVPLSENWGAGAAFQYEHLGSEIEDSPLVDEDGIFTYIGGVAYKF